MVHSLLVIITEKLKIFYVFIFSQDKIILYFLPILPLTCQRCHLQQTFLVSEIYVKKSSVFTISENVNEEGKINTNSLNNLLNKFNFVDEIQLRFNN